MTIAERISEAEAKHAALRAKRGADALDGRKVNAAEIAAVEAELEALADAEVEQTKRERAVTAHARKSRRAEQTERLRELDRKRTEALTAAEEGARLLATSLEKALSLNTLMAAEFRELNDMVPMPMQPIAAAGRLSNRLSAVLSATFKNRRLGNLELRHSTEKADASWPVEEGKILAPYLTPILEQKS